MGKANDIRSLLQAVYKPAVPCPEFKEGLLKHLVKEMEEGKLLQAGEGKSVTTRHEVVELRGTGLSYAEIGRRVGITRERVRQILKPKPSPQKPDLNSKVMLTTGDVGQLLGLHPNTVRRWSNKGILKSYRISPRGDRRFKREDIDGFLQGAEFE